MGTYASKGKGPESYNGKIVAYIPESLFEVEQKKNCLLIKQLINRQACLPAGRLAYR